MGEFAPRRSYVSEEDLPHPGTAEGRYDWDEVYQRFFPLVHAKVRASIGWDAEDARDLVHEILEITIRNVKHGRFSGRSSLGTYIYAITRNQVTGYLRRTGQRRVVRLDFEVPAHSNPESLFESKRRHIRLQRALSRLRPHHRDVIYKRYYEGMRVAEIGGAMGIPARKVSELLHYGLGKMRASLRSEEI